MAVAENTGYPVGWFKHQDIAKDLYECAVCLEVVKDAMQDRDCGHLFCRYCIEGVMKVQAQCPTCRKEISEEMIFPDKNANRAIGKLEVNCPSTRCEWSGTLNSLLQEHNPRCPFFILNCNNMGCDMQVIRQELEDHLTKCKHRTVVCEHCKDEHVFKDKDEHLSICLFLPVECENKCSEKNILRNEMEEHLDTVCPKTVIECKYSELGCEYECERQEMEEHLNQAMKEHFELSTLEISRLKKQHEEYINELKEKISEEVTRQVTDKVILIVPPIMIITDFKKKLSEAKEKNMESIIDGDPFYTSPHGYKLKMSVYLNETRHEYKGHMGVYIHVMKSDHDAILSWPFKKRHTFTLIDQQDNEVERKNIVFTMTPEDQNHFKRPIKKENEGWGYPSFVSHATLQTRKYIKDDTVFITVSIEQ